jgi:hypothetical protein
MKIIQVENKLNSKLVPSNALTIIFFLFSVPKQEMALLTSAGKPAVSPEFF